MKQKKVCILILGMHRSGTSMTTRVLNLMGAGLPATLITGLEDNKKGHWESKPLVLHNDKLLHRLSSSWSEGRLFPLTLFSARRQARIKRDLIRILSSEYGDQSVIVLKDPRVCLLADLYVAVLHKAGYQVHLVVPLRHPAEVTRSLKARSNWPLGKDDTAAVRLWLVHVLGAARAAQHMPHSVLHYSALMHGPLDVARRLKREIKLLSLRPDREARITDFVAPSRSSGADTPKATPSLDLGESELAWLNALWDSLSSAEQLSGQVVEEIELGLARFESLREPERRPLDWFRRLRAWLRP